MKLSCPRYNNIHPARNQRSYAASKHSRIQNQLLLIFQNVMGCGIGFLQNPRTLNPNNQEDEEEEEELPAMADARSIDLDSLLHPFHERALLAEVSTPIFILIQICSFCW
jgi:hypothetical protein